MDDERWEPGMPALDRQPAGSSTPASRLQPNLPPSLAALPPRSVPEVAPTPLQKQYINLSAIALVAGAIAITGLELGMPLGSLLIKVCVVIAAPLIILVNGDALVRIWRSAWAWMPVNRGRGLFRLTWVAAGLIGLLAIAGAAVAVVLA